MIKDKITPELKSNFIEEIKITKETGKERGFFLCENEKGKLFSSKSQQGTDRDIHLGDPRTGCPPESKNHGEFHTHPYLYGIKQELRTKGQRVPPDGEIKAFSNKNIRDAHIKGTGVKGVTINSPSYTDILRALLAKTLSVGGTVCTSTDIDTDNIECWSIKDMPITTLKKLSIMAMNELDKVRPEGSQLTKQWIDKISDRETIYLK